MSRVTEIITLMKNSADKEKYSQQLVDDFYNASNYYQYFENIIKEIGVSSFIENYDFRKIEEYFKKNDDLYQKDSVFVSLLKAVETRNDVIEYILNDDYLFDQLFSNIDRTVYTLFNTTIFTNLDYDKVVRIIEKIEESNYRYSNYFISNIESDKQRKLLSENLSLETLYWMIPQFNVEVLKEFFLNDKRAYNVFLNDIINIDYLLNNGIKFQKDVLYSEMLFERIKSTSMVEFRRRLNLLLESNTNIFLMDKANNYLSSLINTYNPNTELFETYQELTLDNIEQKSRESDNGYILSIVNLHDTNNIKDESKLKEYLKKETSKKLKELIIDYLFHDNYHNVWLNIKELLEYNNSLDNPLIEKEYLEFYNEIFNFERLSNADILNLYNKYKNSNINTLFYEHLRISKDHVYNSIKNQLYKPDEVNKNEELSAEYTAKYMPKENNSQISDFITKLFKPKKENKNEKLSKEVQIYELTGEPFTMLVRGSNRKFTPVTTDKRKCYSIIDHTNVLGIIESSYKYGYYNVDPQMIIHMFENNAYSNLYGTTAVNRIKESKYLTKTRRNNEIQIATKKQDDNHIAMKPDFIVAKSYNISNIEIEEAKRLNIPIVAIDVYAYMDKYSGNNLETYSSLDISDGCSYINTIEGEQEANRMKR